MANIGCEQSGTCSLRSARTRVGSSRHPDNSERLLEDTAAVSELFVRTLTVFVLSNHARSTTSASSMAGLSGNGPQLSLWPPCQAAVCRITVLCFAEKLPGTGFNCPSFHDLPLRFVIPSLYPPDQPVSCPTDPGCSRPFGMCRGAAVLRIAQRRDLLPALCWFGFVVVAHAHGHPSTMFTIAHGATPTRWACS